MKKILYASLVLGLMTIGSTSIPCDCDEFRCELPRCHHGKVEICKIPPGNPENAHTICVSKHAVKSHLRTGSYLGPCVDNFDTEGDTGDDNGNSSDSTGNNGDTTSDFDNNGTGEGTEGTTEEDGDDSSTEPEVDGGSTTDLELDTSSDNEPQRTDVGEDTSIELEDHGVKEEPRTDVEVIDDCSCGNNTKEDKEIEEELDSNVEKKDKEIIFAGGGCSMVFHKYNSIFSILF